MATYESYKDSGVKWPGQIPSHWEILPGKAIFDENKTKNTTNRETFVLSLSYGNIIPKRDINEGLVPENYSGYQIVEPGYIIIRCTDLQNDKVSLRTGHVNHHGIISGAYLGLKVKRGVNSRYIHYLLHNWDVSKELYRYGSGLRQSLSWADIKYLLLAKPPLSEQEAIVAYLDKVTGDIDRAIEAQRKMIDALNERKQIIITRAVTSGLNPGAPLRDSGIGWLGQIPEHWEIKKLKALSDIKGRIGFRGYTNSDLVEQGEGAITLSPSNIVHGKMSYNKCSYLSWHKYFESPEIMVANGHILFVKTGSSYGKTAFVTDLTMEATINPQFSLIKPKKVNPYFLNYAISSQYFKLQVERGVIGSTIPTISQSAIGNMLVLTPPLSEQISIIEYLNSHFEDLDSIISNCERMISLLQERKQIIINEIVTGKTKVT